MEIARTERLILREFIEADAENIYQLNLDPDVLKYTGDKAFENPAEALVFLRNYDHYKKHGFGRWAVIHQTNNEFLGWCGLKYTEVNNEYDIGFRFFKRYWSQGFAGESAKACLDLGFQRFGIAEIIGRAMKENLASIKVLEKIGMTFRQPFIFDGSEGLIYEIQKPA